MSEQALNRTIDTLMDRIEKLRAENLSLRSQIAKNEAESDRIIEEHISSKQNPCQDGPESTGDTGGMVGCQPGGKNTAGVKLCVQEPMSREDIVFKISELEEKIEEIESHDSGYSITLYNECRHYREQIASLFDRLGQMEEL